MEPAAKRARTALAPAALAAAIDGLRWKRVGQLVAHPDIATVINTPYEGLVPLQRLARAVAGDCDESIPRDLVDAMLDVDGINYEARGDGGEFAIIEICSDDADAEWMLRPLIERGARTDVSSRDGTPLPVLAMRAFKGVSLKRFNDLSGTTAKGRSAFHYVTTPEQVRVLLERVPHLMDAPDHRGMTPLHAFAGVTCYNAYNQEAIQCVELLLESDAAIPAIDDMSCDCALRAAIERAENKYGSLDEAQRRWRAMRSLGAAGSHTKSATKQK